MFTGIVTAVGTVRRLGRTARGLSLTIAAPGRGVKLGESVAVDGACLTVEASGAGSFRVHVVATTLDRTAFGGYVPGRKVNLERALKIGDRLGGHLVQGHVDAVGRVGKIEAVGDARVLDLEVGAAIATVTIPLGSITVNGVSLTVNAMPAPGIIQISLIPFTLRATTLGALRPGDPVHLEADTIGKYVAALLKARQG